MKNAMQLKGIIKNLAKEKHISARLVMGHADITVTLNVYTHASYTKVADEMAQITAV